MSIPNETLQKVGRICTVLSANHAGADEAQLVHEIESQALSAQREINIVKAAVSAKQRDIRMLELTSTEVKQLSTDTKVYEGVGKMSVPPSRLSQ